MGSRLKGKKSRPKSKLEKRTLFKLMVYAAMILGSLALLWYLWLGDRGWEIANDLNRDKPGAKTTNTP